MLTTTASKLSEGNIMSSLTGAEVDLLVQDELAELMAGDTDVAKQAAEDAEEFFRVLRTLRQVRRDQDIKQKAVANEMGTAQSAVSALENGRNDPQLSTLMRYARAVGARVALNVAIDGQSLVQGSGRWVPGAGVSKPRVRRGHLSSVPELEAWAASARRTG